MLSVIEDSTTEVVTTDESLTYQQTNMSKPLPVPQMPLDEFTPEPIDTDIEESPIDLLYKLSTHLAVEEYDVETINAAATAASKLLKNLKSRQRAIQKKAKKAAEPPKKRATHGSKIPSTAAIFARENSDMAARWYADGGRIANFNQARGAQTAKYLANLWKDVPEVVRQQYAFKRQAIVAARAAEADTASIIHQALMNPSGGVPDPMFLAQ